MLPNDAADRAPVTTQNDALHKRQGLISGVALFTGIGAIIASSCCVIPLLLAAIGASAGVFTAFQMLAEYKNTILVLSGTCLLGGWFIWFRNRHVPDCCSANDCPSPSQRKTTLTLLLVSTLVVLIALGWEHLEPSLLKMIKGHL